MRLRHLALTASLVLAVTACGSDDEEAAPAATTAPAATSAAPAASGDPAADPAPAGGERTVLIGTIGTPDDPEAFEIGLTDEDGNPLKEVPAGDYTIKVDDQSSIHNWHITGDGVDEETGVSDKESVSFDVTLTPGDYDYVCDPHTGSMSETLTVT